MPWYVVLLAVLAVFIVPAVLGYYLSRMWRMPDYYGKIALVIFTTLAGVVICVFGWPPKMGIDLRGGVILVYDIPESGMEKVKAAAEPGEAPKAQQAAGSKQAVNMDKLIGAIGKRVNPGGVREITIRPYGSRAVEIIVPEADEVEARRMKSIISRIGTLEFRILATTNKQLYRSYIERAKTLPENQTKLLDEAGNVLAWWVPVTQGQETKFPESDIATRRVKLRNPLTRKLEDRLEILVVKDQFDVNGGYLTSASSGESMGKPAVFFQFDANGARRFGGLTGSHKPDEERNFKYYLGIILDGELYSAPFINQPIFERGEITGDFTPEQLQELVDVLNAGSLPTALSTNPINETFTGPTLGRDTIRMGGNSIALSLLVVCGFMLVYYRFSGVVACLALAVNLILLLACMIAVKAAFSLPGLAGFALTVGMAVDSNVLIYERIREEMDRGAGLRMAIRNGFDRAFSAIFDSHLTTLISAAVLYAVAQEQIKGFAITLFLGVAINLYTAIFAVHVVFDVAERQKLITKLKMMRFLTKPNIDFWGLRFRCYTLSIVLTLIGLIGVFARGQGFLNIDFTGGVSVQTVFDKPQDITRVRTTLEKVVNPDVIVADVKVEGEASGRRFKIDTATPPDTDANEYMKTVQEKIQKAFSGELTVNTVTVSDLRPVAAASAAKPEATAKPQAKGTSEGPAKPAVPAIQVPPKTEAPAAPKSAPAGKTPTEPKKQSRLDLPSQSLLASSDPSSVLLALADSAPKPAAKPQATGKAEAAAKPQAMPQSPAPTATPPAGTSPSAKPPAPSATAPVSPLPAPVSPLPSSPATKPAADRFAGGTEATLHFREAIRYDGLDRLIHGELEKELGEAGGSIDFDASNSRYAEGDTTAYDTWTVKIALPTAKAQSLFAVLQGHLRNSPYFPSSDTIGGSVAEGTRIQAVYAVIVSNLLIMLYLWVRFQRLSYGVAAVVALIHDVLVALGFLAMSFYVADLFNSIGLRFLMVEKFKIGMTEVAAFLTIVGYSVSDTVVVFDRIREVRGKSPQVTPEIINASINQTMSRTILTSLTAWLVVVVLYFMGGPTIHGFAFAMIIGILTGTYSSIYVAAPLLLVGSKHAAVKPEADRKSRDDETQTRRVERRRP